MTREELDALVMPIAELIQAGKVRGFVWLMDFSIPDGESVTMGGKDLSLPELCVASYSVLKELHQPLSLFLLAMQKTAELDAQRN